MRRVLRGLVVVGVLGVAARAGAFDRTFAPATTTLRGERAEIPLRPTESGLLDLPVVVDGVAVRCVLDTGASSSLVSPELVKSAKLGLYKLSRVTMKDAGGNRSTDRVAWINQCALSADVELGRLDAVQADLKRLGVVDGKPVGLVLCPASLADLLVTIDYPNHRLVLERGTLPEPDGRDVLPLAATRTGHLFVEATLGKYPLRLLLDTGCTPGLVLPRTALAPADAGEAIATALSQFYYGTGSFDVKRAAIDLHVGRHVITRPLYVSQASDQTTLGASYLQHFAITLDLTKRRVRFARATTGPIDVPAQPMLAFHFSRETGTVLTVKEGSSAQRAGVRVGDRIVGVETVGFKEFVAGVPPTGIEHAGHVTFHLVRAAGGAYEASIPLEEMVPPRGGKEGES